MSVVSECKDHSWGAMGPWCSVPASYLQLIPKPMEGSYHCPHFADKKTETEAGLNEMQ